MRHPIRRTLVMLLLLGGSAALLLEPNESVIPDQGPTRLAESSQTPLTAMIDPTATSTQPPAKAVKRMPVARQQIAPRPLAAPIPLPPALPRRTAAVPARRAKPANTRTIRMLVTAYCPCRKCCGKFSDNITANGKSIYANHSMFVAADTRLLKFGTMLSIPGYRGGRAVPVWDRGGKIKGRRIDVFYLSHSHARKWGKRWLNVKVHN